MPPVCGAPGSDAWRFPRSWSAARPLSEEESRLGTLAAGRSPDPGHGPQGTTGPRGTGATIPAPDRPRPGPITTEARLRDPEAFHSPRRTLPDSHASERRPDRRFDRSSAHGLDHPQLLVVQNPELRPAARHLGRPAGQGVHACRRPIEPRLPTQRVCLRGDVLNGSSQAARDSAGTTWRLNGHRDNPAAAPPRAAEPPGPAPLIPPAAITRACRARFNEQVRDMLTA
jgi:hypothetical protein